MTLDHTGHGWDHASMGRPAQSNCRCALAGIAGSVLAPGDVACHRSFHGHVNSTAVITIAML
ncbi:MAG: hypothetical protein HQL37_15035 [Alphaproteobacteria bacterium]|nr:hypothetical protein [Alphaproteobacteria bacterium]